MLRLLGRDTSLAIAGNYATPVTVNGFLCKNCTDVDNAKKHIDPAHPRSGPYGINAKDDPTVKPSAVKPSPAVVFGGALSALNASNDSADPAQRSSTATQLDISA
jgi:hypothetical protein